MLDRALKLESLSKYLTTAKWLLVAKVTQPVSCAAYVSVYLLVLVLLPHWGLKLYRLMGIIKL